MDPAHVGAVVLGPARRLVIRGTECTYEPKLPASFLQFPSAQLGFMVMMMQQYAPARFQAWRREENAKCKIHDPSADELAATLLGSFRNDSFPVIRANLSHVRDIRCFVCDNRAPLLTAPRARFSVQRQLRRQPQTVSLALWFLKQCLSSCPWDGRSILARICIFLISLCLEFGGPHSHASSNPTPAPIPRPRSKPTPAPTPRPPIARRG